MTQDFDPARTALHLIGYQNEYFSPEGALYSVVKEAVPRVLANTSATLAGLRDSPVRLISTPIQFTQDYQELVEPVGILKIIKEVGAFRAHSIGAQTLPMIRAYGSRILEVPGKRGLNAFSNTRLHSLLKKWQIRDVVLLGVVTSLCIESTGREAWESGYRVTIISDATAGKTEFEQNYYCSEIFPMYAEIIDHRTLLSRLTLA